MEGDTLPAVSKHHKGVVDRLQQHLVSPGQDGGNYIDDLGNIGNLENICMPDEAVQETSHNQGIFQVIFFFDQVGGKRTPPVHVFFFTSPVPDIPLIKTQVVALLAAGSGLDIAADRVHLFDLLVNGVGYSQEIGAVILGVAHITVQADIIGIGADIL